MRKPITKSTFPVVQNFQNTEVNFFGRPLNRQRYHDNRSNAFAYVVEGVRATHARKYFNTKCRNFRNTEVVGELAKLL